MAKIRKVQFHNHPILGDLNLDFCDSNGTPADTVLIAGENGTGKSTLLEELFHFSMNKVHGELEIELENERGVATLSYYYREHSGQSYLYVKDDHGMNTNCMFPDVRNRYPLYGIYSDVDINFHSKQVQYVTSLDLDSEGESRRSTNDFPTQINQLLIDVQALDDSDIAFAIQQNPELRGCDLQVERRMPRFTNAFNKMFDGLSYSRVVNQGGHKSILFTKNGTDIPITSLSSGEKQIVYRGCFLLKDVNALNGAFVFVDEPEISLHPTWQMKVMDYYKGIFTNEAGVQTSQIFAVTHSPFIIHNENRRNDKVIVLARDADGKIIVKDKPEYFRCDSVEAVRDAFSIEGFSAEQPTVYLEGRTDEKYFNRALEVYGLNVPFKFKWVGHMDDRGQEVNTGDKALTQAYHFLVACNLPVKNICLFDGDTHHDEQEKNNVYARTMPVYENSKRMKKGIENALVLDSVDTSPFYTQKTKEGDYGDDNTITEFKKMEFCEHICALSSEELEPVFANLKTEIESLVAIFEEG